MERPYETFDFEHDGRVFRASLYYDHIQEPPWENSEGHGPVSGWEHRKKRPGEWVLCEDRGSRRFYDAAEAIKLAKEQGWGLGEEESEKLAKELARPRTINRPKKGEEPKLFAGKLAWRPWQMETMHLPPRDPNKPLTKGEVASEAVRKDFEYLKGWCDDEWHYCGVCVQELIDGEALGDPYGHALWGFESNSDCIKEVAKELAGEIEKRPLRGDRYAVVQGSESGHCCFEATVVDKAKPKTYDTTRFESVCECFDNEMAVKIAAALNEAERG